MLLRDLTKVFVSSYSESNNHGEKDKSWTYKGIAYLNMQQDVNELDRKSTGEIDYSIYKARATMDYSISKGDGISFNDISSSNNFTPDYRVMDKNQIGSTYVYRLEKVQ